MRSRKRDDNVLMDDGAWSMNLLSETFSEDHSALTMSHNGNGEWQSYG
jgi:hypothetical protein